LDSMKTKNIGHDLIKAALLPAQDILSGG